MPYSFCSLYDMKMVLSTNLTKRLTGQGDPHRPPRVPGKLRSTSLRINSAASKAA